LLDFAEFALRLAYGLFRFAFGLQPGIVDYLARIFLDFICDTFADAAHFGVSACFYDFAFRLI
jgi:hypothetical protein